MVKETGRTPRLTGAMAALGLLVFILLPGCGNMDDLTSLVDDVKVQEAINEAEAQLQEGDMSSGISSTSSSSSSSRALDGTSRFLWKPVSETRGGVLVVLLPYQFRDVKDTRQYSNPEVAIYVTKVTVRKNGSTIGTLSLDGIDKNGYRCHYWGDKRGSQYGNDLELVVHLKDGGEKVWRIPNGGARYDVAY